MAKPSHPVPEWSTRILRLLQELKLTQAGLSERLGVSPATVSRWIQGKHEPTAEGYVSLGNLARADECAYFWERAGIEVGKLTESGKKPGASSQVGIEEVHILSGRRSQALSGSMQTVAIPLLAINAYGDGTPPQENVRLSEARIEETLLAPLSWCPHPDQMIAIHLKGDSMMPLIAPSAILSVDTAVTDRDSLNHKLAVVSHRDLGFKVARFQRIGGVDLLIPANQNYAPLDVTNAARWKLFGEVLWWVTRPVAHAA